MATNLIAQVVGGQKKIIDNANTVAEVRAQLGLSAGYKGAVDGEPVEDSFQLQNGNYVSFAEAVKGA